LVEAAWIHRFPPRVGVALARRHGRLPKAVRDIARKAPLRLCGRIRRPTAAGKHANLAVAAVAPEIAAFLSRAIGRAAMPPPSGAPVTPASAT
jgi:hypothetical protein